MGILAIIGDALKLILLFGIIIALADFMQEDSIIEEKVTDAAYLIVGFVCIIIFFLRDLVSTISIPGFTELGFNENAFSNYLDLYSELIFEGIVVIVFFFVEGIPRFLLNLFEIPFSVLQSLAGGNTEITLDIVDIIVFKIDFFDLYFEISINITIPASDLKNLIKGWIEDIPLIGGLLGDILNSVKDITQSAKVGVSVFSHESHPRFSVFGELTGIVPLASQERSFEQTLLGWIDALELPSPEQWFRKVLDRA